jgi:hypothetical protein
MVERDYDPGIEARLHYKDMQIVLEEAHTLGMALPGTALVTQMFNALIGRGGGNQDSSQLVEVVRQSNPAIAPISSTHEPSVSLSTGFFGKSNGLAFPRGRGRIAYERFEKHFERCIHRKIMASKSFFKPQPHDDYTISLNGCWRDHHSLKTNMIDLEPGEYELSVQAAMKKGCRVCKPIQVSMG